MSMWESKQCPAPGCRAEIPTFGRFCATHTVDAVPLVEAPDRAERSSVLVEVRDVLCAIHDARVGRVATGLSAVEMGALRDAIGRLNRLLDSAP